LIQPLYATEIQNTFRQTSIRDDSRAVVAQLRSLTLLRHSVKELLVLHSMANDSVPPGQLFEQENRFYDK